MIICPDRPETILFHCFIAVAVYLPRGRNSEMASLSAALKSIQSSGCTRQYARNCTLHCMQIKKLNISQSINTFICPEIEVYSEHDTEEECKNKNI